MNPAAKHFDLVLGVDIHLVQPPGPVPPVMVTACAGCAMMNTAKATAAVATRSEAARMDFMPRDIADSFGKMGVRLIAFAGATGASAEDAQGCCSEENLLLALACNAGDYPLSRR